VCCACVCVCVLCELRAICGIVYSVMCIVLCVVGCVLCLVHSVLYVVYCLVPVWIVSRGLYDVRFRMPSGGVGYCFVLEVGGADGGLVCRQFSDFFCWRLV